MYIFRHGLVCKVGFLVQLTLVTTMVDLPKLNVAVGPPVSTTAPLYFFLSLEYCFGIHRGVWENTSY